MVWLGPVDSTMWERGCPPDMLSTPVPPSPTSVRTLTITATTVRTRRVPVVRPPPWTDTTGVHSWPKIEGKGPIVCRWGRGRVPRSSRLVIYKYLDKFPCFLIGPVNPLSYFIRTLVRIPWILDYRYSTYLKFSLVKTRESFNPSPRPSQFVPLNNVFVTFLSYVVRICPSLHTGKKRWNGRQTPLCCVFPDRKALSLDTMTELGIWIKV